MKRSGFTLAESLLTMLLLILVLGVAGTLVREYSGVMRHSTGKQRTLQAMMVALERLQTELSEAATVTSPSSAVLVSTLEFAKVDPTLARLPAPPSPPPPGWAPHAAAYLVTVRYRVDASRLVREVQLGGSTRSLTVAEGVTGLGARLLPNGNVEISLAVQEDKMVRTLTSEVFLSSGR